MMKKIIALGFAAALMSGSAFAASTTTSTTNAPGYRGATVGSENGSTTSGSQTTPGRIVTGDGRVGAAAPSAGAKIGGGTDDGSGGAGAGAGAGGAGAGAGAGGGAGGSSGK